ncbi:MAG: M28 family peptidase, partial [bacterium]
MSYIARITSFPARATLLVLLSSLIIFLFCFISTATPQFDSANAWKHLTAQCDFGARVPGTEAHRLCLDYLDSNLAQYAESVERQSFWDSHPVTGETLRFTNLIARFGSQHSRRLLLCAHWDSRPWSDQDPDPENRQMPVLGANDGASGVAVLLEIARCLSLQDPGIG